MLYRRLIGQGIGLCAALAMTGCAVLPGMAMSPEQDEVELTMITPELIRAESERKAFEEAELLADNSDRVAPKTLLPATTEPYQLGAGDVLAITIWGHAELGGSGERPPSEPGHVVDPEGNLFFPYAGKVKAQGLTVEGFRQALTSSLLRVFKDPQVSVRVQQFRSQQVYVGGEVAAAGVQPISEVPLRLLDAMTGAGGASENADLERIELKRGGRSYTLNLRAFFEQRDFSQNPLLQHGDVLNIPSLYENQVFVLGEVEKPGPQPMGYRRVTLTEALAAAGGVDQMTSAPSQIYVVRNSTGDKRLVFNLDARSADALALADRFSLEPRDVVFVDATGMVRWNRLVSQVLPSAATAERAAATNVPFQGRRFERK